jgi:hypothetical protein
MRTGFALIVARFAIVYLHNIVFPSQTPSLGYWDENCYISACMRIGEILEKSPHLIRYIRSLGLPLVVAGGAELAKIAYPSLRALNVYFLTEEQHSIPDPLLGLICSLISLPSMEKFCFAATSLRGYYALLVDH